MEVGIEALNAFAGTAYLDVKKLAQYRQLDMERFDNLLMKQKTVALPYEDPISFAVNAAKPIVDALTPAEKDRIEMVITGTESAFDFGKSMSTYIHQLLGLNRNCRLFEVKNACYSGVAALQTAVSFILSQASPNAKALVIATDISRFMLVEGEKASSMSWHFAEPSAGAGAVAALVSNRPFVLQMDVGANGYYGYEVMDTCRPVADSEAGDADLSLLSYLDCAENSYLEYHKRVPESDYVSTFDYLAFHTPFGGMIKGAHRNIMRKIARWQPDEIEKDFAKRVLPGLTYCQRVGNMMGATTLFSLFSTLENADYSEPKRLGIFSYGSGCCSEFFSGLSNQESQACVNNHDFKRRLDARYELSIEEYESLLYGSTNIKFGTRNFVADVNFIAPARTTLKQPVLFLKEIKEFHREYEWVG
jgi:polyketide biosynthesis 3-hydroxy-3-methylglutaryl-CoA synthase-like enzyme PksG